MIGGLEINKEDGSQWVSFLQKKPTEFQQASATHSHAMLSTDNGKLSKDLPLTSFLEPKLTLTQKNSLKKERWLLDIEIDYKIIFKNDDALEIKKFN